MSGAAAVQERFGRSIGELGHAVSALQARSRSQEARLTELAETRGDVSARSRRGINDGVAHRQFAAQLEHQGRVYDERLCALEGRLEVLSEAVDAASSVAADAAASAEAAATASAAAASHYSSNSRVRPSSRAATSSASPARSFEENGRTHGDGSRMQLLEETVASLRSRIDLLESQRLNSLRASSTVRSGSGFREDCEVRSVQSLAEDAHKRLSQIEGQMSQNQREMAEGVSKLQSELSMSLKLVRVDAARAEGALEAKLEEVTEKLKSRAEQVGQHVDRLLGRISSSHPEVDGRDFNPRRSSRFSPRSSLQPDARVLEVPEQMDNWQALSTLEGSLRTVCEQQHNFDIQVASIMSSVKACGEEQERLSRRAADQDAWLQNAVKSEVGELRSAEERFSRRLADHDACVRELLRSEVGELRGAEERLLQRTADHDVWVEERFLQQTADRDVWLREALKREVVEFRSAEEDRYRDATMTAEHALAECSERIRDIGAKLENELGAERGETLRSLAAVEARVDCLTAERTLGRPEAQTLAALEARLEALALDRTSVQAAAASGSAALQSHIDGVAARLSSLEAYLVRDVERALCQADEAAAVAQAAETTAQRGEADGRASAARLEAKLEAWLEARRDMLRDAVEELRREAQDAAEAQARSVSTRAEEEAELAGRIARRAESAVRLLHESESEAAGQLMRAEVALSERLMRFSSDEAISAGRASQRTENSLEQVQQQILRTDSSLGQLQKQMQDLALMTTQKCTAAERSEARCDTLCGDLSAAIGNVREECLLRFKEVHGVSERAAVSAIASTRDEYQVVVRKEVATAVSLLRGEIQERLQHLEERISGAQKMRAGEVREHLASIAEQVTQFESRLAPEALARLVRREVELATRDAVQEELRDQFRSGWFQQADFKFDCTLQCLHVLYLKAGVSPSGALGTLQRAVRGGGSDHPESGRLVDRSSREESGRLVDRGSREESGPHVAVGRPPQSPGGPSGSGGFASASPTVGLLTASSAAGDGGSSCSRHNAPAARPLSARGPSTGAGIGNVGPGAPGGPGGRDARSASRPGSPPSFARSPSPATARGSSPAAPMRRTPRGSSGATTPPGPGGGRPRRHGADYSLIE